MHYSQGRIQEGEGVTGAIVEFVSFHSPVLLLLLILMKNLINCSSLMLGRNGFQKPVIDQL